MVLDLDRLAERVGLDREDVADLLEVFLETAPAAAENLERALRERDFAVAARAAHTIKGGAATVGLEESAGLAAELERRLRTLAGQDDAQASDNDGLDAQVQALHNCLERVRTAYEDASP